MGQQLESWRSVFREGLLPLLSDDHLEVLAKALREDDERLLQGATTSPAPLLCVQDWAVEGACVVGYCGWQGDGLATVGEVEAYFSKTCTAIDNAMGEPASCRFFLNWYDETGRKEMLQELLAEVLRGISERAIQCINVSLKN